MSSISKKEIEQLAEKVVNLTVSGNSEGALTVLKPILDFKCPFAKLDTLGRQIGKASVQIDIPKFFETFDRIIDYNAMGGVVIVGQSLIHFLPLAFEKVMEKSREYIIKGDVWYVCDIIGERSLGHALVCHFDTTVPWLKKFLDDDNKWIRRSVGVSIHFFSKRVLDQPQKTRVLLKLIEPHLEEKQIDFVKGIGWGLKTIGKHHPDILVDFLKPHMKKNISALLVRKAVTYLGEERKSEVLTT